MFDAGEWYKEIIRQQSGVLSARDNLVNKLSENLPKLGNETAGQWYLRKRQERLQNATKSSLFKEKRTAMLKRYYDN